jgi:hypothetical protein
MKEWILKIESTIKKRKYQRTTIRIYMRLKAEQSIESTNTNKTQYP